MFDFARDQTSAAGSLKEQVLLLVTVCAILAIPLAIISATIVLIFYVSSPLVGVGVLVALVGTGIANNLARRRSGPVKADPKRGRSAEGSD